MLDNFNWDHVLSAVSKKIGQHEFQAWLQPTRLLRVRDGKLQIGVPTQFHCDWIQDHFKSIIEEAAQEIYHTPIEVVTSVLSGSSPSEPAKTEVIHSRDNSFDSLDFDSPHEQLVLGQMIEETSTPEVREETQDDDGGRAAPLPVATQTSKIKTVGEPLNTQNTFENFVVGSSNQFAHAACRAVAEFPASQYNPLFIYSNAGLGKTHLLHAIGNYFRQHHPKLKICYLSAETFANELIECIRTQRMPQFRQKYRDGCDLLLMDDFQFIAGKDRTQEEFFHTFNALHRSARQIVVTSDKSPKDIPGLEDRIRTRFECGLIADIQPPEIETRIAILRAKSERDDIFLPDDVALFLASNIKSNIRELEGALIRLEAQASLNGVEISLDLAKRELSTMMKEPIASVSPDAILNAVSRYFDIKVADLKSKDRSRKFSMPRQISMYLLRRYTPKSLPEIGICLGGKDHSTVLYGINAIETALETDPVIQRHVQEIQNLL